MNGLQDIGNCARPVRAAGWIVQQVQWFGNQPRDPVAWIETAVGVLKHHVHLAPHGQIGTLTG